MRTDNARATPAELSARSVHRTHAIGFRTQAEASAPPPSSPAQKEFKIPNDHVLLPFLFWLKGFIRKNSI